MTFTHIGFVILIERNENKIKGREDIFREDRRAMISSNFLKYLHPKVTLNELEFFRVRTVHL